MGESNDVFISYNWNIKQQVEVLERRLNEKGFSVWRDVNEFGAINFDSSIRKAIDDSKNVICCITKDYCRSENCNLEFNYAFNLNKPLIALLIDDLEPTKLHEIDVKNRNYPCGIGIKILLVH